LVSGGWPETYDDTLSHAIGFLFFRAFHSLEDNAIGDEGAMAIGEALRKNTGLQVLRFDGLKVMKKEDCVIRWVGNLRGRTWGG